MFLYRYWTALLLSSRLERREQQSLHVKEYRQEDGIKSEKKTASRSRPKLLVKYYFRDCPRKSGTNGHFIL